MALAASNGRIALEGRLDMQSCAKLAQELSQAVSSGSVELDLAAVSAVDSAALALLINAQRRAQSCGQRLRIANPPASLLSLAHLYGAEHLLSLENTP
jgi:phospholipid transport system transporter-binding protein